MINQSNNLRNFIPILICTVGLILAGCGSDDGNSMGPDPNPDPDPDPNPNRLVSYSEDISIIFQANCATSGCHDSGTQESGVNLASYDDALNSVGDQYGENIINPGNPGNSPIMDKITEGGPEFGVRMPQDGPPYLNDTQIDSIRAWIEDGAPDN